MKEVPSRLGRDSWITIVLKAITVLVLSNPVRIAISSNYLTSFSILDIFVAIGVIALIVRGLTGRLVIGPRPVLVALAIPPIIALLSFGWAENRHNCIKHVGYSVEAFGLYLLVLNIFRGARAREIVRVGCAIVGLSTITAVLYWTHNPTIWAIFGFTSDSWTSWDAYERAADFARLNHPYLGRSNDYGTILCVLATFLYGSLLVRRSVFVASAFGLAVVALGLTLSRGVILSFVVSIALFVFVSRRIRGTVFLLGILCAGVLSVGYYIEGVSESGVNIIDDRLRNTQNIEERYYRFQEAIGLMRESPLLGVGAGHYLQTSGVNSLAFHNTYVEQLVAFGVLLGVVSIAALFALPVAIFKYAQRVGAPRVAAWTGVFSVCSYLLISSSQTSNEAAVPRLVIHAIIGLTVLYVTALSTERDALRHDSRVNR